MKNFLKKINLDYKFGLIIFVIGLVFAILMPIYQIPDEPDHLKMVYDEMNQSLDTSKIYGDGFGTYGIIASDKTKLDIDKYFNFDRKITEKLELKVPKVTAVRHLPQILAAYISHLFNLNTFVALFLMELFAIIAYSISCMVAIKITPVKKTMFKYLMLFPICIQQACSLSYDCMLLSFSFIFIAYILNLKFRKENTNLKELLIGFLLLMVVTICKIPYLLLGLMFIILYDKISIKLGKVTINWEFIKKNKYKVIPTLIILVLLVMVLMTKNSFTRNALAFLLNPIQLIQIEYISIKFKFLFYFYSLTGSFSWFNVHASYIFCAILLGLFFLSFFADDDKYKLNNIMKVITFIITIILVGIIVISMYFYSINIIYGMGDILNYNLHDMIKIIRETSHLPIYGIQGRYFVPFIPLVALLFNSKKITSLLKKINFNLISIIFWSIAYIYIFGILINSFWV